MYSIIHIWFHLKSRHYHWTIKCDMPWCYLPAIIGLNILAASKTCIYDTFKINPPKYIIPDHTPLFQIMHRFSRSCTVIDTNTIQLYKKEVLSLKTCCCFFAFMPWYLTLNTKCINKLYIYNVCCAGIQVCNPSHRYYLKNAPTSDYMRQVEEFRTMGL